MGRVLLADDHELVRETIAAYLTQNGAHEVTSVGSFDEAVEALKADDYDLVMLDYRMPGMEALDGLRDVAATGELLEFMGYQKAESGHGLTRYVIEGGNAADTIDLEELPNAPAAGEGAGTVHHIAFAVENRAAQDKVRKALLDTGYQVTPVIDRDYFWAIYFRTPGGVLFEIATNEPGFDRDEDTAQLGQALKLPTRYEPYRSQIEGLLPAIGA